MLIRFLEKMFYVSYLKDAQSYRKRGINSIESLHVISSVIGPVLSLGFFFVSLYFLAGVLFDFRATDFFRHEFFGTTAIFFFPLLAFIVLYFLCLKHGKYKTFKEKYPDVNIDNVSNYVDRFLIAPYLGSAFLFVFFFMLSFYLGRGV